MAKYKIISLFAVLLSFLSASAQLTPMTAFQYGFKRIVVDSTLQIPSFCGVPTLRNSTVKNGALAMDTCNNKLYKYTRSDGWSEVAGGGGTIPNLQAVTDSGNTTTNYVDLIATGYLNRLEYDKINIYGYNESSQISMNLNSDNPYFYISNPTQNTYFYNNQLVQGSEISHYPINNGVTDTLATLADIKSKSIDSIKRNAGTDSVFARKNGSWLFQYRDSIGGGGSSQNGRFGNDTATMVMAKVHNNSGVQLTNGKVVFLATSGTSSDAPSVRLANNKADSTSANTFGFVSGTINNNDTGWVVLSGKIEKLNTSAFSNGDVIYLDSVSGQWTKTKPVAPYHMVYLGVVVKANAGNGSIFVKPQNGYELDEIHDVLITSKTNNDVLAYESSTKLWKNKQISTVLGYTPIAPSDTANMLTNYAKTSAVNLKVNISDTANMLTNYAKTSAVNLKVNISDTANMLINYAKTSVVNAADALKVNISDTASMLSKYQRKDTSCFYLISDVSTTNLTATNTNLTFSIAANETYRIMIAGTAKNSTTGQVKIAIGAPTGCTMRGIVSGGGATMGSSMINQALNAVNTLSGSFSSGSNIETAFRFEGSITNGANAGSITLQFAAGTTGTATIFSGTIMQLNKTKGL